jgi:hypothetical protein
MAERGMLGDDASDADLDVIGMRPNRKEIDLGDGHRVAI